MSTLDNLRKSARRWLKALRADDADAHARLKRADPNASSNPALRDVQHALAACRFTAGRCRMTRLRVADLTSGVGAPWGRFGRAVSAVVRASGRCHCALGGNHARLWHVGQASVGGPGARRHGTVGDDAVLGLLAVTGRCRRLPVRWLTEDVMVTCACTDVHKRRRLVFTGGPGAGKTALLELIRQSFCSHVKVLPEAAGVVLVFSWDLPRGGAWPVRGCHPSAHANPRTRLQQPEFIENREGNSCGRYRRAHSAGLGAAPAAIRR